MEDRNKFAYVLKCNPVVELKPTNEDHFTIPQRIASIHLQNVNDAVLNELRQVGKDKGINDLIVIDEYKVMDMVKRAKAYDLIAMKQVDMWLVNHCDYENYIRIRKSAKIDTKVYCDDGAVIDTGELTEDEFYGLKEMQF